VWSNEGLEITLFIQWAQIVLIMEKAVGWRDLLKYQKEYMYKDSQWRGYFAYTSYDNVCHTVTNQLIVYCKLFILAGCG
jgi:hypothetical protein